MRDMIKWELEDSIIGLAVNYKEFQDLFFNKLYKELFHSEINQKCFEMLKQLNRKSNIQQAIWNDGIRQKYSEEIQHLIYCISQFDYRKTQWEILVKELIQNDYRRKHEQILIEANQMSLRGENTETVNFFITESLKQNQDLFDHNIFSLTELSDIYGTEEKYKEINESVVKFGFIDFDNKVIIKNGDLIIIAGRPSSGKTDIALAMSKNIAKNFIPVGFISLEMKAQYLMNRLALGESNKSDKPKRFIEGVEKISRLPIYIDESPKHDLITLKKSILKMVDYYNCKIIFIDYLTLLNSPEDSENRTQEVTKLIGTLKIYAREFNIPIVVLSQLSRNVEKRKDKKPILADLRESGAIEQDADLIIFTYKPYIYGVKTDKTGTSLKNHLLLCIQKQRDGMIADVPIYYDAENKIFGNWQTKGDL
ncbi:MAG: DnaB-like helicase C-terminal domain-containing protein [Ignavibacteria bacterium]|nr:DnaB-like helicase C-terminal domain-containing protein [Ignavibacteria bacterium]